MTSLRKKLFMQMGLLVLLLVALSMIANTFLLKPYYTSRLKGRLTELYREINTISGDYDESLGKFLSMEASNSVDILIMNTEDEIIYTSNSFFVDERYRERLERIKEAEGEDFLPMITRREWIGGIPPKPPKDEEHPPKKIEKIEAVNDQISLFYAYGDPLFGNKLLILSGYLDSGEMLELKIPEIYIDRSVKITNRFMIIYGLILFFIAMVFAYVLSTSFTRPIMAINDVTKELSQLNFKKKCQVTSTDEIGQLSRSINHLSDRLSETIEELNLKNDELETLIHDVSHELKTPLALLQGYAEGIQMNVVEGREKLDFYTEVIIDETKKMNRIVESLLDIKQLVRPEKTLFKKHFSLKSLVDKTVLKINPLLEEHNYQVVVDAEGDWLVYADAFRMEQVLMNYLTNAIQYTDGKEAIRIHLSQEETVCRLSIYNSSEDISEDVLAHLWDKFYKADASRTRMKGGHGLGLSIVKAIQEAHGRDCGVYKEKNGLTFWADIQQ